MLHTATEAGPVRACITDNMPDDIGAKILDRLRVLENLAADLDSTSSRINTQLFGASKVDHEDSAEEPPRPDGFIYRLDDILGSAERHMVATRVSLEEIAQL